MDSENKKKVKSLKELLLKSGKATMVINLITVYRIIMAPFLVILLFIGYLDIFKWLLLISFLTDAVDGYLARKYNVASILGAKLDSIGDDLTVLVGIIGVFKTRPEFIESEIVIFITLIALFIIQLIYALVRYRKTTSFHTYLAKTAAVLQGMFILSLFFFEDIFYPLFYIASAITALELIEEIILVSLLPQWKANVKGLPWVIKKWNRVVE